MADRFALYQATDDDIPTPVGGQFLKRDAGNTAWEFGAIASSPFTQGTNEVHPTTAADSINIGTSGVTDAKLVVQDDAQASGSPSTVRFIGAAHTGMTAAVEAVGLDLDFSATKTWATGTIASQREVYIRAPTYAFTGGSAITDASTFAISGPPIAGTNASFSNAYAFRVESGVTRLDGNVHASSNMLIGTGPLGFAPLHVSTTFPEMRLSETGASADNKHWRNLASGENLYFRLLNDAGSADANWLVVSRSGITPVSITYPAGNVAYGGNPGGARLTAESTGTQLQLGYDTNTFTQLATVSGGGLKISHPTYTSGTPYVLQVEGQAHTGLTAATEVVGVDLALQATKTWATGAISTQREVLIQAPTYAFAGASTITDASTLAISGAPIPGANATITNPYAFWIQSGKTRLGGDLAHTGTNVGFFSATPVAQQTDSVALTDSTGGTANNTVAAVSGSGDDATINDNFADLVAKYNALRTVLRNLGLMA